MRVNREIQGTNVGRLGSRTKVHCGRCGRELNAGRRKKPLFCKDCRGTDPQFCN